jgi:hypothetical protein
LGTARRELGRRCPTRGGAGWGAAKKARSHDVDDVVAFKVLHRGEWVYPDDVDLD